VQPAARIENKRKHIRTKVNFKACIRSSAFGEDIVTCEDMSEAAYDSRAGKNTL